MSALASTIGNALGTGVAFDDGESLRDRLGGRIGMALGELLKNEIYLEGNVWNEFLGDFTSTLSSNGFAINVSQDVGGVIGEVAGGLNFFDIGGWNGFARGAVQFGEDDYFGYSGQVGVRTTW